MTMLEESFKAIESSAFPVEKLPPDANGKMRWLTNPPMLLVKNASVQFPKFYTLTRRFAKTASNTTDHLVACPPIIRNITMLYNGLLRGQWKNVWASLKELWHYLLKHSRTSR